MDTKDLKMPINNAVIPPISGQVQFASWIGVSEDTVRGWVESKTLPTVKIGKNRYIDVLGYINARDTGKTIFQRGDFET